MKEKEPSPSLLTWESAAIVLVSAGAGFVLGSREARGRIDKEIYLYYRGLRNLIERRRDKKRAAELELKAGKVLAQVFPQGLGAEK